MLQENERRVSQVLDWLDMVDGVNQAIAQSTGAAQTYARISDIVHKHFATRAAFIAELDGRGKQMRILAESRREDLPPCWEDALAALPAYILAQPDFHQEKTILISGDQLEVMRDPSGPSPEDRGRAKNQPKLLIVPLRQREQVLGCLGFEVPEEGPNITQEEYGLLRIISTPIAQFIGETHRLEQAKTQAIEEERNRLARDLHDSVTQVLFSATLVAEVLPQIWRRNPEKALQSLEKLRRLTRGALAEMRTMLLELRPAAVVKTPLSELLAQLTDAVTSRSGLPFQLFIEQVPPLPEEVQLNFYRIAQEALNNVVKHAQAKSVIVSLSETPFQHKEVGEPACEIKLVIQDDGVGFFSENPQAGRLGIGIMNERAAAIQARLAIESEPGYGTLVSLIWAERPKSENQ